MARSVANRGVLLLAALLGGSALVPPAAAQTGDGGPESRVVVTFAPGEEAAAEAPTLPGDEATAIGPQEAVVEATPAEVAAIAARPDVIAVEPDGPARIAVEPADPCWRGVSPCFGAGQTGLRRVGAATAWDVVSGSTGANPDVVVAVIDTGVAATHPDLAGRVDVVPRTVASGQDPCGIVGTTDGSSISHGTRVASIIAAAGDGAGMVGVVPGRVRIRSYKALADDGNGTTADVVAAINCAVDHGVDVINLSLTATDATVLRNAVARAESAGIVVVAAAGNQGRVDSTGRVPASYPSVIAVAATTASGARASFSNAGPWIDIAAPGVGVLAGTNTGGYGAEIDGTSFSTPFVSGAAALLLARQPSASVAQVRARLEGTAETLADRNLGRGLLDISGAVRFPAAGAPACSTGQQPGYVLDAYGGRHSIGGAPRLTGGTYWPGWDIARDIATAPGLPGAYVLDGYGGLHTLSGAPRLTGGTYWPGWDIARAVARRPDGLGAYILDGYGGIHVKRVPGTTPTRGRGGPHWPGWDIARDIAVDPTDSTRGFVLDGFGGVHPFGFGAAHPSVPTTWYQPGRDLARRLVLLPDGRGGYVLDAEGRLHPFTVGNAPMPPEVAPSTFPYGPGRGVDIRNGQISVASGFGTVQRASSVPCVPTASWPGWDVARAFAAAP